MFTDWKRLGANIKMEMTIQGISQKELSRRCNINESNLSQVLTGKVNFTPKMLDMICKELNITAKDLI